MCIPEDLTTASCWRGIWMRDGDNDLVGPTLSVGPVSPGGRPTTVLRGRSVDQAALQGILFQIFALGMLMKCIHCVAVDDEDAGVA